MHSAPSSSEAPRNYTPRSGTALWPYGVPGKVDNQHTSNHSSHPPDGGHGEPRERFPYVYGGSTGLIPYGYGLPLAYGGNYLDDPATPQPAPPPPDNLESREPPAAQVAASEDAPGARPLYRPMYEGSSALPPVHPQPATTLIFRDGRPSQQVHNYALTASTLYALDGDTRQEIPLSLLNVPATVDANRAAGVEFALPVRR